MDQLQGHQVLTAVNNPQEVDLVDMYRKCLTYIYFDLTSALDIIKTNFTVFQMIFIPM